MRVGPCLAVVLLLIPGTAAAETEWQLRLERDGITVKSRTPDGERHQEFLAQAEIDASMAQIIALLQDTDACNRWLFRCEHARVVERISNQERYFYQVTDLPFPARSRDGVFHASVSYNPDQSVTIRMTSHPERLPESGHIRIQHSYGTYHLMPVSDDRTGIAWQMFIDPAGALPAWIVNSMLTDLPYRSLEQLRELVQQAPYSQAVFTYDKEGIPSDIVFPRRH